MSHEFMPDRRFAQRARSAAFSLLTLLSVGCGFVRPSGQAASPSSSPAQEGTSPPLEVAILSSKRMGSLLAVKVQLKPKTDLETADIAITLLGLKDGAVIAEQTVGLDEVTEESEVDAGEDVPILLTLNGDGFNEYQVRTSWGTDRERVRAKSAAENAPTVKVSEPPAEKPSSVQEILSSRIMQIEKEQQTCRKPPCDFKYVVTLELNNSSQTKQINDISVAVGLFWVESGKEPKLPIPWSDLLPNEEPLALEGITLAAGESRSIRLKLDTDVPVIPGGALQPGARLLSANVR